MEQKTVCKRILLLSDKKTPSFLYGLIGSTLPSFLLFLRTDVKKQFLIMYSELLM
jgi:hypothetical protein